MTSDPVQQFIDAKGIAHVAEATGRSVGAIRVWKHRKRFPKGAWAELVAAFPEELPLARLKALDAARMERAS